MLDIMVVVSFCSTKKFAPEWGIFLLGKFNDIRMLCLPSACVFKYIWVNSKILSLVAKNIQACLILFHSFICIFVRVKAPETTIMAKYKEYGYDIQDGKAMIPEWVAEIKETINL